MDRKRLGNFIVAFPRLLVAAVCMTTAVIIDDGYGLGGDLADGVLCLAAAWMITDTVVLIVARAIRDAVPQDRSDRQ